MLHVDFQGVVASLGIILKLISINISISNLGFSDEMHELVLCLSKRMPIDIVANISLIDKMLVAAIDLFSVHNKVNYSNKC
jgi:hypothetical protein